MIGQSHAAAWTVSAGGLNSYTTASMTADEGDTAALVVGARTLRPGWLARWTIRLG
jgi:hypothetical protein